MQTCAFKLASKTMTGHRSENWHRRHWSEAGSCIRDFNWVMCSDLVMVGISPATLGGGGFSWRWCMALERTVVRAMKEAQCAHLQSTLPFLTLAIRKRRLNSGKAREADAVLSRSSPKLWHFLEVLYPR